MKQRFLAALLLALALAAGLSGTALAHAKRVSSTPEAGARLTKAPDKVTIVFSEEISDKPSESYANVTNAQGRQIATGKLDTNDLDHKTLSTTLPASLADGVYTVSWQAVTPDDGGISRGKFTFGVNAAPGAQPANLEGEEVEDAQATAAATSAPTAVATAVATAAAATSAPRPQATSQTPASTPAGTPLPAGDTAAGLPRTGGDSTLPVVLVAGALVALVLGLALRRGLRNH